jgi:hypothetical protein
MPIVAPSAERAAHFRAIRSAGLHCPQSVEDGVVAAVGGGVVRVCMWVGGVWMCVSVFWFFCVCGGRGSVGIARTTRQ